MSLICVSLFQSSVQDLSDIANKCKTLGADVIELRVDFLGSNEPITISILDELKQLRESVDIPIVLTIRPSWEGGKFNGTEDERVQHLTHGIELGFDYVDIEFNMDKENRDELTGLAANKGIKTIVSYHDFQKTPQEQDLLSMLENCCAIGNIGKVAVQTESYNDAINIIRVAKLAHEKQLNFSVMGTGPFGEVTRILSPAVGCSMVYASPGEPNKVVEGQVDIVTLKEFWEILGYI